MVPLRGGEAHEAPGRSWVGRSGIEVSALCKSFGDVPALRGLDFAAAGGQIFGVVGPDGAGKTTLSRILVGLMTHDSGTISVLGLDPTRDRARLSRSIGYVPQTFSMFPSLTVEENLEFVASCHRLGRRAF